MRFKINKNILRLHSESSDCDFRAETTLEDVFLTILDRKDGTNVFEQKEQSSEKDFSAIQMDELKDPHDTSHIDDDDIVGVAQPAAP